LFDSFELQVYGEVRGHKVVRQKNVEYIAACCKHSDFFNNYIEQEGSSVDKYLQDKSKGAWGDTPDIYALAELYQQRVMIYDPEANLIAVYGEVWSGLRPDIGLLFWHSKRHYDVVVPLTWNAGKPSTTPAPGKYEDRRIKRAQADGPSQEVLQFRDEILSKDILLGDVADALVEGTVDEPASDSKQEEQEASESRQPLSTSYLNSHAIETKIFKREMTIIFTPYPESDTESGTDQKPAAARKELEKDYEECLEVCHGLVCRNLQLEDTLKTVLDETDRA
jgi:hypothetical protein